MKKLLSLILITFIFSACSQQGQSITTPTIILEEVKTVIKEQGLELKEADLPENNVFIQELNGVSPKAYYLDGTTLSIYVFPSVEDRKKGEEAFEKANAAASLEPYKTYTVQNVLVFYVEGKEKINKELATAIDGLG